MPHKKEEQSSAPWKSGQTSETFSVDMTTAPAMKPRRIRAESHVKEAEMGVMSLQAKERQGLPEPPEAKKEAWRDFPGGPVR